jgi:hypothetical protein
MRYTIALQNTCDRATVQAVAGVVVFNGRNLLPFEADMIGKALLDCADRAEVLADQVAGGVQPDQLELAV